MSKNEERLVDSLIREIVFINGRGLDKEDCYIVCWIAYLENKTLYMGRASFWEDVALCIIKEVDSLRKNRSSRCRIESKLSLDQKIGPLDTEVREYLRPRRMYFEDRIALWDFAGRLGAEKEQVMRFMAQGEDEDYIRKIMRFSKIEYSHLREELKEDMMYYQTL